MEKGAAGGGGTTIVNHGRKGQILKDKGDMDFEDLFPV